jgi:hypothetical protein
MLSFFRVALAVVGFHAIDQHGCILEPTLMFSAPSRFIRRTTRTNPVITSFIPRPSTFIAKPNKALVAEQDIIALITFLDVVTSLFHIHAGTRLDFTLTLRFVTGLEIFLDSNVLFKLTERMFDILQRQR